MRALVLSVLLATATSAQTPAPFRVEETTIAQIHEALKAGRLTCRALVEQYLRRIDAYDKNGPAKFTYNEKNNMIRLKSSVFNQNVGPKEMRELFSMIDFEVHEHASAWDPDKWGTATPPEGTK